MRCKLHSSRHSYVHSPYLLGAIGIGAVSICKYRRCRYGSCRYRSFRYRSFRYRSCMYRSFRYMQVQELQVQELQVYVGRYTNSRYRQVYLGALGIGWQQKESPTGLLNKKLGLANPVYIVTRDTRFGNLGKMLKFLGNFIGLIVTSSLYPTYSHYTLILYMSLSLSLSLFRT